jgi:hypothetical protein
VAVLGCTFSNGSPVNITDDAAVYLLCALTHRGCRGVRAEHVVESRLLVLESLLSLV